MHAQSTHRVRFCRNALIALRDAERTEESNVCWCDLFDMLEILWLSLVNKRTYRTIHSHRAALSKAFGQHTATKNACMTEHNTHACTDEMWKKKRISNECGSPWGVYCDVRARLKARRKNRMCVHIWKPQFLYIWLPTLGAHMCWLVVCVRESNLAQQSTNAKAA